MQDVARSYRIVLFAFALVVVAVIVAFTAKALLVLFGGYLFALVLRGLGQALARRTRVSYTACVVSIIFALIVCAVTMLVLVGPRLHDELIELGNRLPGAIRSALAWLHHTRIAHAIAPTPTTGGASAQTVAAGAFVALGTTLEIVAGLVIVFFIGVYGAVRPRDYARIAFSLTPKPFQRGAIRRLHYISTNLTRWLLGRLIAMLFVGIGCAIAFTILDVPLSLALAVLAGLLTFIEYIGALLSAIPPVVLTFTRSPSHALAVLILFVFIHVIEGYVLTPILARATVRFPPAATLAGQTIFAALVGSLGLTFSTPILIVIVSAAGKLGLPHRTAGHLGEQVGRYFGSVRRWGSSIADSIRRASARSRARVLRKS